MESSGVNNKSINIWNSQVNCEATDFLHGTLHTVITTNGPD